MLLSHRARLAYLTLASYSAIDTGNSSPITESDGSIPTSEVGRTGENSAGSTVGGGAGERDGFEGDKLDCTLFPFVLRRYISVCRLHS